MQNLEKISTHKQILNPSGEQKVPVVFHVNDELMPEQPTIEQLKNAASDSRVFHHVVALTDVHSKPGRKNPTGTAVATEKYIFPQTVDTAPNCGMRMIKTPFEVDDLSTELIHELFQELIKTVPTKAYLGKFLPHRTILEISKRGSVALLEHFKKDTSEIENTMNRGNMFLDEKITDEDLFGAIPKIFFRIAQLRLGIMGAAGNHFLDLMKIDNILEPEIASKLGVKKGQYVFLLHTGSGMFGQYCSYFYTPKIKEHASQRFVANLGHQTFKNKDEDWHRQLEIDLKEYKDKKDFYGIDEKSELGRAFQIAHKAAANHGFANRSLLQLNIEATIHKVLGKEMKLPIVHDMTHISIMKERHFEKDVWVHRNGLVRAYGPEKFKSLRNDQALFEQTGEPVYAPSSMSTAAYLGVGTDENESTFCSAPHGTGRSKTKTSDVPQSKEELFEKMKRQNVRLYNAKSKGVVQQDSSHYKDIEKGLEGLKENHIMKPVAKMMPVAVLMY
jgi:tRNA-splicing ligase RtcB (3'-phosphate/5'-hydroxy nucleic acid ligase)